MGIWDSILKYGGKAAKATGRSMGHAALHPSQTLRGTGQAVKTAAIGGAVGYVGWEKLTTDKSVVHIVSDAVIGKSATDTLADAADGVRELTSKAGEAVGSVSGTVAGIDSKLGGVSNFLRQVSNGGVSDMFGNYNPQIQISAESETKRSIFREKDKTKRSKKESAQHSKSRNKSFVMTSVSAL